MGLANFQKIPVTSVTGVKTQSISMITNGDSVYELRQDNRKQLIYFNRPFYQYCGHIELIRFKEYYRMPMGHEHISFVFSSAFGTFFLQVFSE